MVLAVAGVVLGLAMVTEWLLTMVVVCRLVVIVSARQLAGCFFVRLCLGQGSAVAGTATVEWGRM